MDAARLRGRLGEARLLLVFVPELCAPRDPEQVLAELLPHVDLVQVRPKPLGDPTASTEARAALDWSRRALALARALGEEAPPITVNDRVDVAAALAPEGLAGVHLGQDDMPPALAREELGEVPLIGLSTHDAAQVVSASEEPVDYLGFGPAFPTTTKGYVRGQGPERVWIASAAATRPLFAIGGIDLANAAELAQVGRVAVGSALLRAPDPARAALELRALLRA